MIIEAHGGGERRAKYTLFHKVGKAELNEGRAHFDALGRGRRVNPYKDPRARITDEARRNAEVIYILGHGGETMLNGESAGVWADRLQAMGLQANDTCTIDLTSCYGGSKGRGFAASLTVKLRLRDITATVIASRGHHHETATATHIFDPRNGFYSMLWAQAGADDPAQEAFLTNAANTLYGQMPVNVPDPQERATLYIMFLNRVGERTGKVAKMNAVVLHAFQLQQWQDRALIIGSKVQAYILKDAEYASMFIKLVKGTHRNAPALLAARQAISAEAQRIWGVHKGIIEGQGMLFQGRTMPPLAQTRITFSTADLDGATQFGEERLEDIDQRRWLELRAVCSASNKERTVQRARAFEKTLYKVKDRTRRPGKFEILKQVGLGFRIKWEFDCKLTDGRRKNVKLRMIVIPVGAGFQLHDFTIEDA